MSSEHAPSSKRPATLSTLQGYAEMWRLAWPVSVSTSTHMFLMLANLFWIGQLGTAAIAALSLTSHILFIAFGLTQIVSVGTVAVVARRKGERNTKLAFAASVHAVALGCLLGIVVSAAGWVAAAPVISFFDVEEAVARLAVPYLEIAFAGHIFFFVTMGIGASYQGMGDTRTPMILSAFIVAVNAVIDPLLIFAPGELVWKGIDLGLAGFGVPGAAIADVIASALGCLAFVALWLSRYSPFPRSIRKAVRISSDGLWQIVRIGVPAGITMLARPLSTFFLLKVIASFGTTALAAFGIVLRAFSLNFIPFSGLNAAVATLVGQKLGARAPEQARWVVRRGVLAGVILAVTFCLVYANFAGPLIGLFDSDPAVIATGVPFLLTIAIGQLFTGSTMPLAAAMNGAGDTRPPMVAALSANWLVKLPLAFALALPLGFGVRGVWIGMFSSMLLETLLLVLWFRRGRWTTATV